MSVTTASSANRITHNITYFHFPTTTPIEVCPLHRWETVWLTIKQISDICITMIKSAFLFKSNDNGGDKELSFMPRLGSFGQADPIIRQRTRTASGSMGILSDTSSLLHRAPGSERENMELKNMGVS